MIKAICIQKHRSGKMQHSRFRTKPTKSRRVRNKAKARAIKVAACSLMAASTFFAVCSTDTYAVDTLNTENNNSIQKLIVMAEPNQESESEGSITLSQQLAKGAIKVSAEKIQELVNTSESEMTQGEIEDWIFGFLTTSEDLGGAGLTKAGASAVMGCIEHESRFITSAENRIDSGYGLLQWTNTPGSGRRASLEKWCSNNGYRVDSVEGQMQFFKHELKSKFSSELGYSYGVYETLKTSGSIEECLKMFFCHAEAGQDVKISTSVTYGGTNTQVLYDNRYESAWKFYNNY